MCTDRAALRPHRQRGLTMIELILFIVIISVGVVGILGAMSMTTSKSADPVRRKQAIMIAEEVMEEVMQAEMSLCDPADPNYATATTVAQCTIPEAFGNEVAGATRPYDNVNDYVTAANTAQRSFDVNGVLVNAAGAALPAGYVATVRMANESFGNPAVPANAALHVTITVSYDNTSFALDGYRTQYQ